MEVYIEFKPCYLTIYIYDENGYKVPARSPHDFSNDNLHIIDGKCDSQYWNITDDYKYVYGFYNGQPTYFRVCNISSSPILNKDNKVKKWHELTKQINKLKEERKALMQ